MGGKQLPFRRNYGDAENLEWSPTFSNVLMSMSKQRTLKKEKKELSGQAIRKNTLAEHHDAREGTFQGKDALMKSRKPQ
jgi:hypothetical protein